MFKIRHNQSGRGIHNQVAERVEHAVADIIRNAQRFSVQHFNEARVATAMRRVCSARWMRSRNKQHISAQEQILLSGSKHAAAIHFTLNGLASRSRFDHPARDVLRTVWKSLSDGKEEMAATVMDRVAGEFASDLLAPLNEPGDPAERLRETGERLRKFYGSGKKACLLDTLTLNRESPAVQARANAALEFWIDSFARFAVDSCGLPPVLAMERAQDAVSALEGGLVIARVAGNRAPFMRAIESLPERLMLVSAGVSK
jgi:TetR/AcrR family transcriptional repressor of lmrAB and yxaGH operons